jgi:hypothetical protein
LVAFFGSVTVNMTTFASSTGNNSQPAADYNLYVAVSQLFQLTAQAGATVSGASVLLRPGAYHVRFVANEGDLVPPFGLRGLNLSDPVGAASDDPTMQPMYQSSNDSSEYSYPDGNTSSDPYEWHLPEILLQISLRDKPALMHALPQFLCYSCGRPPVIILGKRCVCRRNATT